MANRVISNEGTSISRTNGRTWALHTQFALLGTKISTDFGGNAAIGGATIRGARNSIFLRTGLVRSYLITNRTNILIVEAGANDFATGDRAADILDVAALVSYCHMQRAFGFKVIGTTLLPRGTGWPEGAVAVAAFNAARNNLVNPALRASVGTQLDGLIDWAADPTIGPDSAANDSFYFNADGLHPTMQGQFQMGNIEARVLQNFPADQ